MAAADIPGTVLNALIACGVDNVTLFLGETQAQRIADDIFDDTFTSCMDVTFKELDANECYRTKAQRYCILQRPTTSGRANTCGMTDPYNPNQYTDTFEWSLPMCMRIYV
jgi:hypothetical protein